MRYLMVWLALLGLNNSLVRHGADVVTFVDEDDIGRRQFHSVGAHASPIERLDAGDLHERLRSRVLVAPGLEDAGHDVEEVF